MPHLPWREAFRLSLLVLEVQPTCQASLSELCSIYCFTVALNVSLELIELCCDLQVWLLHSLPCLLLVSPSVLLHWTDLIHSCPLCRYIIFLLLNYYIYGMGKCCKDPIPYVSSKKLGHLNWMSEILES